jgi:hypothetical protein
LAPVKGSVQLKLRLVKNNDDRWVLAWDCGAGHYFLKNNKRAWVLYRASIPTSVANLRGDFWNNMQRKENSFLRFSYLFLETYAAPILLALRFLLRFRRSMANF